MAANIAGLEESLSRIEQGSCTIGDLMKHLNEALPNDLGDGRPSVARAMA